MALSTTAGTGDITNQADTQSPQTSAGSGSPLTAAAKNVQPGTASSLLTGSVGGGAGIPLSSTILPVTNLNSSTSTQTTSQTQQSTTKPAQHHPNAILLAIVIILFVMAALAFWLTKRSAKNTTNY